MVAWGPVVLWMGLIFFLSAQPDLPSPEDSVLDFIVKKSAHTLEYAILTLLWLRALEGGWPSPGRRLALAWLVTCLYALTDEYHQSFVPGRTATLRDVAFDWLGASLAAWVWWRCKRTRLSGHVSGFTQQ